MCSLTAANTNICERALWKMRRERATDALRRQRRISDARPKLSAGFNNKQRTYTRFILFGERERNSLANLRPLN